MSIDLESLHQAKAVIYCGTLDGDSLEKLESWLKTDQSKQAWVAGSEPFRSRLDRCVSVDLDKQLLLDIAKQFPLSELCIAGNPLYGSEVASWLYDQCVAHVLSMHWYQDYGKQALLNACHLCKRPLEFFASYKGKNTGSVCLVGGSSNIDHTVLKKVSDCMPIMSVGRGAETIHNKYSSIGAIALDPVYAPTFNVERLFCLAQVSRGFIDQANHVVLAGTIDEHSHLVRSVFQRSVHVLPTYKGGGTSALFAVELATEMGFTSIYLVGFDHTVSKEDPCAIPSSIEGVFTKYDFLASVRGIAAFIKQRPEISVFHINAKGLTIDGAKPLGKLPQKQGLSVLPSVENCIFSCNYDAIRKESQQILVLVEEAMQSEVLPKYSDWHLYQFYQLHLLPLWQLWKHRFPLEHRDWYEVVFIKEVCEKFSS